MRLRKIKIFLKDVNFKFKYDELNFNIKYD